MNKAESSLFPSLKIRIDFAPEGRIGPGKIRLLEAINTCGSISAAGREMKMSYRHAWGLLDDLARTCKRDVIKGRAGGEQGGGAELTPFGRKLVARYRKIERSILEAAHEELVAFKADLP